MKTVGQLLKDARVGRQYTVNYVEKHTKIKSTFINAIEQEKWDDLPPFPTVLGFVKSISTTLAIDPVMAVAVLKRDYPPKNLRIVPKPDVAKKFMWSPKLTFALGISLVILIIGGYLAFQYIRFISPPRLTVESPKEGQVINGTSVTVFGSSDSDVKIVVNGQPVMVSADGKFTVSLDVVPETKEVVVKASSRSGKMSEIKRKIVVTSN